MYIYIYTHFIIMNENIITNIINVYTRIKPPQNKDISS